MESYSVYVHIPFCTHRCGYCDFNTYAGLETLIPAYVAALVKEIEFFAKSAGEKLPAHSVFFGGGTPSLLPIQDVEKILSALGRSFSFAGDIEMTLEANPGTVSRTFLKGLRMAGFNRLSLGVQSAKPEELRLLERQHSFEDVIDAVSWARQAGFENINLDWIFGLPGQSMATWQRNLKLAVSLGPEHLSLYSLSIEHGTPFKDMMERGLFPLPDGDLAADMYEHALAALNDAGFLQYEISNWARTGKDGQPLACRHNLQYWRNSPYIGFGAGAHGYLAGLRIVNTLSPKSYIQQLQKGAAHEFPRTPATASAEEIDQVREMSETMMMGLRLVQEGVSKSSFNSRFKRSLDDAYGPAILRLVEKGLLQNGIGDALRLTHRGKLLGNQVFMQFV